MTIPMILAVFGILAFLSIIYLARGHYRTGGDLGELASRLRPIDVESFRNLIDQGEEEFLRRHLLPDDFRSIHRERSLAAVEYVWGAAQNASILIRLAEAARHDSDPATSAAAEKLLENALRLRIYAFHAVPRMYLGTILPWATARPAFVADTYETMTRQVVMLGCMQFSTRGMSSAL